MNAQQRCILLTTFAFAIVSHQLQAQAVGQDYYNNEHNMALAQKEFEQGNYTETVFALERVLALAPNNKEAGLLLARTYAKLHEYSAAQLQYAKVKPLVNAAERRELAQEEALMLRAQRFSRSALIGFDIGYDDNLTSLANIDSVFIPARNQNLALDDSKVEEGVAMRLFAAGSLRYQQQQQQWWRFDGIVSQRQDERYNQRQFYGAVGYYRQFKAAQYKVQVDSSYATADDLDSRTNYNVRLERQQNLNNGSWSSELKFSQRRYGEQSIRNDRRGGVKLSYKRELSYDWIGEVSINTSSDLQTNNARKDLDYTNKGLALRFTKTLNDQLKLTIDGDYQRYDYRAEDPSFIRVRRDNLVHLKTSLRYQYNKKSSVAARLEWLRNDSNIALNEYDKKAVTFSYIYRFE
jgi:hypothetical protein